MIGMVARVSPRALCVCATVVAASATAGPTVADGFPGIEFRGLLDFRAARTGASTSLWDEGLGKSEFTGDGGERVAAQYPEGHLVGLASIDWDLLGVLHLRARADQDFPVDVVEGFVRYRPVSTSNWRFSARAGAFFPPVSVENDALAWTSPHTLSFSAINSWIGEEIRAIGAEGSVEYRGEDRDYRLTGGLFAANDPAGAVIATRGWALHGRVTSLFEKTPYALDDRPGAFGNVKLFSEIDGRPGAYVAGRISKPGVGVLRAIAYDNFAREDAFDDDGFQHVWRTRFVGAGARYEGPFGVELIGQFMTGDTAFKPDGTDANRIDVRYESGFVMASKTWDEHQVAIRHDIFSTEDQNPKPSRSPLDEDGHAITFAYVYKPWEGHRFGAEVQHRRHTRPQRVDFGDDADERETIFQFGYRFVF